MTKRVYEPSEDRDGERVLVDRVWPRGIRKEQARIDRWIRELAPSTALRKWFDHDPEKWEAFRQRYRAELQSGEGEALLRELADHVRTGNVTLVYAARESRYNNAEALKGFLLEAMQR